MKKLTLLVALLSATVLWSQDHPGKYAVENVNVNTKYSDFGTAFFGKDKVVFASPREGAVITRTTWDGNKQPFLDLFMATIDENGNLKGKKKVLGDVNTKYHEGVVAFTKDLKTVYYSANNYVKRKYRKDSTGTNNIQMFKATVGANGEWTNIRLLPFNSPDFSSGHPTLSIDDKKLYFVSDRPESIGKTDIYVVDIYDDGTFSAPRNMGPKINTEEREMFPFISDDNILYYSSNGLPGNGDLDVFASKIYDNTVADPINLGEPVNSKKDDFAYIIDDTKHKGYFSSNRKGGNGDDDIYMLTASPPIHFECNQVVKGIVRDKETEELLPGAVVTLNDNQGNKIDEVTVGQDAAFSFELPCDTEIVLVANLPGFIKEELPTKTANDLNVDPLEVFLDLPPELVVVDEKIMINVNTIYFDFDRAIIRPEAAKELDKVVAVMKEHPSMVIEAGSHTDSRAREAYNQKLSERRANATVDYIVSKGIDRNRITAKGYGEMQLVNNCSSFVKCSREEHQLNRRTEFVIVNDDTRFASVNANIESVKIDRAINRTYVAIDAAANPTNVAESNTPVKVESNTPNTQDLAPYLDEKRPIKKIKPIYVPSDGSVVKKVSKKYVKFDPIYYAYDDWSLSSDELVKLGQVVKVLNQDKELVVEIQVHTDSKNTEKHNQLLSDKRARSIASYMASRNVSPDQVYVKGFGEHILVNKCKSFVKCSEDDHQANRRIEFVIIDGNGYPDQPILAKESERFINTNPIYFNYDRHDIRKDAAYELNRVAEILKQYPDMKIEAGSHTDANNTEAYNQVLSEKRATSVKNYLVAAGIDPGRITSKGYGEMQLVNNCSSFVKCTAEQHQENRRTEFKILKNQ